VNSFAQIEKRPTTASNSAPNPLVQALDNALPQTQCTRCGYPDCRSYAQAIASGAAAINQCPPGGEEGVMRLAAITEQSAIALNPQHGTEAPRLLAVIDESWCIGCTLCLAACPVDAIVGASKQMHTVINNECTGCELCVPACPVDCISLTPITGEYTGWAAWSTQQAERARVRYTEHQVRLQRRDFEQEAKLQTQPQATFTGDAAGAEKISIIQAALNRARARQSP
jgi:Na+-translocating ferredoxin:NAD+ oxidoreductase subunit B